MGSLGLPEIAFIFVLALLIFGPKKLPEMGRTLGRGVAEFRKATNELKRTINTEMALDEQPVPPVLRPRRLEEAGEARREAVTAEPGEVPVARAPSPELPLSAPADTESWSAPARALDPDDPR
jgi:sec-independent protein translocase protein TatA